MTRDEIEALRKLIEKATRQPWRVTSGIVPSIDSVERVIVEAVHRSTSGGGWVVANCGPVGEYGSDNDAKLIAALVNNASALLDAAEENERLKAALERVEQIRGSLVVHHEAIGERRAEFVETYKEIARSALAPQIRDDGSGK